MLGHGQSRGSKKNIHAAGILLTPQRFYGITAWKAGSQKSIGADVIDAKRLGTTTGGAVALDAGFAVEQIGRRWQGQ